MGIFSFFRKKPGTAWDELQSNPLFQQQQELLAAMELLCEDGFDADELPNGNGEFGMVSTNPIPCRTVAGSNSYLNRLQTLDGESIAFERSGSTRSGVSPHPVDEYRIFDGHGRYLATIFITPYQKRISSKAPRGFKLRDSLQVAPPNESLAQPSADDGRVETFTRFMFTQEMLLKGPGGELQLTEPEKPRYAHFALGALDLLTRTMSDPQERRSFLIEFAMVWLTPILGEQDTKQHLESYGDNNAELHAVAERGWCAMRTFMLAGTKEFSDLDYKRSCTELYAAVRAL